MLAKCISIAPSQIHSFSWSFIYLRLRRKILTQNQQQPSPFLAKMRSLFSQCAEPQVLVVYHWVNNTNPSFCAPRAGRRKENAKQFALVSNKMSGKTSFIS